MFFWNDGVFDGADPLDLDADHVACPEVMRRFAHRAHARGVPVSIRSPGSKVMACDRCSTMLYTSNTISLVFESWRDSPLTVQAMRSDCGSGMSPAVTIHGPNGQWVSKLLPTMNCEVRSCQSRTLTSLAQQ